jgi:hypothetical protein
MCIAASDKPTITGASPSLGSDTATRFVEELMKTYATRQWEQRPRKRYPGSATVSTVPLHHAIHFFAQSRCDTLSGFNSLTVG